MNVVETAVSKWIQKENANGRKAFRLTPGQWAQWKAYAESGGGLASMQVDSGLSVCPIPLDEFTQAKGDNIVFAPREDLFSETDRDVDLQMVSFATDITAVPDNVACVEVISVGEMVTNCKPGDLAFLDFYSVKQGYILANEELYIAGQDALCGLYDLGSQEILPLDNYVVTRALKRERFVAALTGTDRIEVPRSITSVAGGKTSQGNVSTEVLYEEVVRVGKLTKRPRAGLMTRTERLVLDAICSGSPLLMLTEALLLEREFGRVSDINPCEVVVFCKDIAQRVRCKGEFQHLVPYDNVLAALDDEAILDDAVRRGNAGQLVRL